MDDTQLAAGRTGEWTDFSEPALPPLLQAAADCFVESGYHGTTIRQIAARAGLSVPGYYHHYASKDEILVQLMHRAMAELYRRSLGAAAQAGDQLATQFGSHIACLVLFHAHRADLAFIASSEIRSLRPDARESHIAARDRQQQLLEDIVTEGIEQDLFAVEQPRDANRALITMCTGVSQWFRLGGSMQPEDLATRYIEYGWRMLGGVGGPPEVAMPLGEGSLSSS